jgi:hypothetical protein
MQRRVAERWAPPEWATVFEFDLAEPGVRGYGRRVDAFSLGLWRRTKHTTHAFEIKVSRADYLRELDNPAKASAARHWADHFWLVTPAGVVKDGELPAGWGHLEARGSHLVRKIHAKREPNGQGLTVGLLLAILSKVARTDQQQIDEAVRRAVKLANEEGERENARVREALDHVAAIVGENTGWRGFDEHALRRFRDAAAKLQAADVILQHAEMAALDVRNAVDRVVGVLGADARMAKRLEDAVPEARRVIEEREARWRERA